MPRVVFVVKNNGGITRVQARLKSWGSESGEAQIDGAKRPNSRAKPWERAGRSLERGPRWAPPQKIFGILNFKLFNLVYSWKGDLEIIDFIAM